MDDALLLAIIALILGPGGLVVLWYTNRQRQKDPITQGEAERAWMQDALSTITTSRNVIIEDNTRLENKINSLAEKHNKELKEDRRQMRDMEVRLSAVELLSGNALRYIDALLRHIISAIPGAQVPPPDPSLHDHIDPQLHLWARGEEQDPDDPIP